MNPYRENDPPEGFRVAPSQSPILKPLSPEQIQAERVRLVAEALNRAALRLVESVFGPVRQKRRPRRRRDTESGGPG